MLKKCISILLVLTVLLMFTHISAFALDDGQNEDSPKTTTPGSPVGLKHPPGSGSGGGSRDSGHSGGGGGGGSGGSHSGGGSDSDNGEEDWMFDGYSETYTETTVVKSREILYWNWYVKSGPGTMTMLGSNRSFSKAGKGWHAGSEVTVSFSALGDYLVVSEQWVRDVTTTTTTVKRDAIYKHYSEVGGGYTVTLKRIPEVVSRKTSTEKTDPHPATTRNHPVRVTEKDKPVQIPEEKYLTTTAKAIFSRDYVYTERCIDYYTDKAFELEVIFDFTANTNIVKVLPPTHTITRYLGNGTMTVAPREFRILQNSGRHIKLWAKFIYPKAGEPNKSPMTFPVVVKTKNKGNFTAFEKIDVPVNTFNLRFTDLPDSERGEFYPIKGLTGNLGNYVKDFGTITYGGVLVP